MKSEVRRELRARRRALTSSQQHQAASGVLRQFQRSLLALRYKRVGLYVAGDGEIDPSRITDSLLDRHKLCTLPCLAPTGVNRLRFASVSDNTPMQPNRFNIPEPAKGRRLKALGLDLILLPLVGFDNQGNRLGMGGGFYDRTLTFKRQSRSLGPKLVGLAHECQRVDRVETEAWDIPLDGILTDRRYLPLRRFANRKADD